MHGVEGLSVPPSSGRPLLRWRSSPLSGGHALPTARSSDGPAPGSWSRDGRVRLDQVGFLQALFVLNIVLQISRCSFWKNGFWQTWPFRLPERALGRLTSPGTRECQRLLFFLPVLLLLAEVPGDGDANDLRDGDVGALRSNGLGRRRTHCESRRWALVCWIADLGAEPTHCLLHQYANRQPENQGPQSRGGLLDVLLQVLAAADGGHALEHDDVVLQPALFGEGDSSYRVGFRVWGFQGFRVLGFQGLGLSGFKGFRAENVEDFAS